MNCLKCGVQVEEGQSFCPDCLGEMEKQPLPVDAVLVLPRRGESARRSSVKKRGLSTEEKLEQPSGQVGNRWLPSSVVFLLVVLLASAFFFLMFRRQKPALGQNYSTVGTTSPTDPLPTE